LSDPAEPPAAPPFRPLPLSPLEERVLEAVDLEGLLGCLGELVALRSDRGLESPMQERMAELMEQAGMEVDRWPIDLEALARHPAFSTEIPREEALGVVGRMGEGRGPVLVLNGHVDVVPAGERERWSVPPWQATLRDGRLYGRGAVDMKGALCCALFALRALREAGVVPAGAVLFQSVVGEEDGGLGTLAAVERGHTGDGAIVLEPTELAVAPAQAGALNFRLTVPGRAAHGALRTEGVSPLDHFLPIYAAMQGFEAERNRGVDDPLFADYQIPFPLCIGTLRSGVWASTVAESLVCEGRLGVAVHEEPARVRRAFEALVEGVAEGDPWLREHPPLLEWWGGQFEPAAIPADHPLVTTLAAAHGSATGEPPPLRGMPFGADMRLLVNQGGTPTVMYGPGDIRKAHAPDEYVPVAELEVATRTLALMILRFCGVGG
jgi:acetylornithine deacetylase